MAKEATQISPEMRESLDLAEEQIKELLLNVTDGDGEIKIGDKTVSLNDAFPLTLGDWRKLEKKKLLDTQANVALLGADGIAKLLLHLFQKVDDTVTETDLDGVSLQKVNHLFLFVRKKMQEEEPDLNPTKSNS